MRYVLDTHSLLWLRADNPRFQRAKWEPVLFNPKNEVFVSMVSLWEIAIKHAVKKLDLDASLDDFANTLVDNLGFQLLPIEIAHLKRLGTLPFHHRDPFDRLLIAQTIEIEGVAITDDAQWHNYPVKIKW